MSLLSIDASATGSQKVNTGTVTSAAITTNFTNEVLYAFVISDGSGTVGVTGAGLTWTSVANYKATGISQGVLSVWSAFSAAKLSSQTVTGTDSGGTTDMSIVVLAFQNADNTTFIGNTAHFDNVTGPATATILTTRNNSWVWALYYDTTANTTPTLPAGLTKFFDFADTNDLGRQTYIQKNTVTGVAGTSVTINATAPADSVAMLVFEILPSMPSFRQRSIRPHPFSPGIAR